MKILKIVAFILLVSSIVSKREGKDDFFKKFQKEIIFKGANLSNENSNPFFNFMPELFEKLNQINPINEVEQFIDDIYSENMYERNINNEKFEDESMPNIPNFIRNFNEFEIFEENKENLRKQNALNRDRHDRDRHERERHDRERHERERHDRHHHRHSKFLFVNIFHNKPLNIIFFVLTTLALIALITFLSIKIVKRCKKIRRDASGDEENISNVNRSLENPNNITNIDEKKSEKNLKETTTPYLEFNSEYVDINRYSIKESLNNDF